MNHETLIHNAISQVRDEMKKHIIGQHILIDRLLIALFADGHMILEGVPGLAKTLAASSLANALDLHFSRIQFTPDLLPSDLLGGQMYNQIEAKFYTKK
jgi:MoxR-like ATPase